MKESIFYASIRALFVSFFTLIGIALGLIPFFLIIAALSGSSITEADQRFTKEVVANAKGERTILSKDAPVILKININGVIGSDELTSENIQRQLVESREGDLKNNRVKALLLNINSPGGTAIDSDGIYRAIKTYKEQYKVPVYAYIDGMCASGGMYVACAADQIYASDSSIVGSVGVLIPSFLNFTDLLKKVGVQSMTLHAGKGKDELNPLRPWKEGEEAPIQDLVNYYYNQFVEIVVANRPQIDKEKLVHDYGANVFNPKKAQEFGYITGSGYSLRDTLKLLLAKIGIEDDYYQVYEMKHTNWYNSLFQTKMQSQLKLPLELDPTFTNQYLYLYRP